MIKKYCILLFAVLLLPTFSFASVQLGSPKILVEPSPTPAPLSIDDNNINTDSLLKLIEEIVSHDHPEMYGRWQKYLRTQNLDPDNETRTMRRLEQKYLDSIKNWGTQVAECESSRSSGRWLRRLKRKFGETEVAYHKKEIAKIITSLYLKRKTECMQTHEELALRAERELNAFSLERTRLLIEFISQNSEIHISQLNKYRLLSGFKRKQNAHTLGDRTVDLNSLRLETKLQNLPKSYVDFLAHEQSFKKPFDLHKNLSMLSSEYDEDKTLKKTRRRPKKQVDINMKTAS